uniref:Uncharacterized protein n=1 Tax=viral metagenome TaxID=1070528 RepID=A0A6H1ZT34_9ZZZZ
MDQVLYQQIKEQILQSKREHHFLCESSRSINECGSCHKAVQREWSVSGECSFLERENQRTSRPMYLHNNILCIPIRCSFAVDGLAIIKLPLLCISLQTQLKLFSEEVNIS